MRITDKTDDRLVLTDDQADKRFALKAASVFLAGVAVFMAWQGFWEVLPIAALLIAGLVLYGKRSAMRSTLTFSRAKDEVELVVEDRAGTKSWTWKLGDVATAEISTLGEHGTDSGTARPNLVLRDGTRVPMRPYHAAGTQSWNAVAAVKLFLGQDLDDAPTGWLPPQEFDTFFATEMARHHK